MLAIYIIVYLLIGLTIESFFIIFENAEIDDDSIKTVLLWPIPISVLVITFILLGIRWAAVTIKGK